jgi:hypothetical protein
MSASTLTSRDVAQGGRSEVVASGTSFWDRVAVWFAPFIAARQRRADRMITTYLATLDDATLRDLGMEPSEVRARAGNRAALFIV